MLQIAALKEVNYDIMYDIMVQVLYVYVNT